MPPQRPVKITLPATSDCAFWASLMVSWVAQDAEGLLAVDGPALWFIAIGAIGLAGAAVACALIRPWPNGWMKLSPGFAKIIFITTIVLTAAWLAIGIAYTRAPSAQWLYGLCALLSGWSACAIFIALVRFEADQRNAAP